MSLSRIERRLQKKQREKRNAETVAGFTVLQRFVYEGLRNRTILTSDVVEMCKTFLSDELKQQHVQDVCVEILEKADYAIIAPPGPDDEVAEFTPPCDIHLDVDGNMWCATFPGFTDLQVSPAGFGKTIPLAIADLYKNYRR